MSKKTAEGFATVKVNLPVDLKLWLHSKAKKNLRPANSQIILELRAAQAKDTGNQIVSASDP